MRKGGREGGRERGRVWFVACSFALHGLPEISDQGLLLTLAREGGREGGRDGGREG